MGPGGLLGGGSGVGAWTPRPQLHPGSWHCPLADCACRQGGLASAGAVIQYLGSKHSFYCVLFILSSAFETFSNLKNDSLEVGAHCALGAHAPPRGASVMGLQESRHPPALAERGRRQAALPKLCGPGPSRHWLKKAQLLGSPSRGPVTEAKDLLCSENFEEHLGPSEAHPQIPPSGLQPLPEGPLRSAFSE